MRTCKLIMAAAVMALSALSVAAQNKLNIRFASAAETNAYLGKPSSYTDGWGRFDMECRAGKVGAKAEDVFAFRTTQGVDFTQSEKDSLLVTARKIEKFLDDNGMTVPAPKEIVLAKTTMKEEGDAGGYTLENWIFLGGRLDRSTSGSLLAHELAHVLTRNNREYRAELYKTIDFTVLDHEIEFPADIVDSHISNPDVASYDSYAYFTVGGKKQPCTMMIWSGKEYKDMVGQSFFRNMVTGLIPLDSNFKPIVQDGKTLKYPIEECSDFYDVVGRNTGYVINPEECLADNFAMIIAGSRRPAQTPELLEKIKAVLKKNWLK